MRQMPQESLKKGRSNDDTYELICVGCGRYTRHKVLESIGVDSSDEWLSYYDDYQIATCQGCGSVSFVHQSKDTASYHVDRQTDERILIPSVLVYPPRLDGFVKVDTATFPSKLKQVYNETHTAIGSELWIMAAVGMRTIIELICIDQSISGGNLEQKINKLQTKALVSSTIVDLLHGVRFLGNDAVHTIEVPKREELNSAWNLVNNLLGSIYIVQTARDLLPNSDSRSKNKAQTKKADKKST